MEALDAPLGPHYWRAPVDNDRGSNMTSTEASKGFWQPGGIGLWPDSAPITLADGGPALKPSSRRARVDTRRAARDALVFLVIREAVNKGIADLARAREIASMIAVAPYLSSAAAERGVE